jgi:hypothetical protein
LPLASIPVVFADESDTSENLERLANAYPDSAALHAKLALANFSKGTVRGRVADKLSGQVAITETRLRIESDVQY